MSEALNFIKITDIIDILCVASIIYMILWVVSQSHSVTALRGTMGLLLGMVVVYAFAKFFNLITLTMLFSSFWFSIIIVFIIIFQTEIRKSLMSLGQSWFLRKILQNKSTPQTFQTISEAVFEMSRTKTGALICIELNDSLATYARSGVRLNAEITSELIRTIFTPPSPLHDGAVIIVGDKINTAACLLPYSKNKEASDGVIIKDMGTRHLAALGISEETDCIVIVVSEETGTITICQNGELARRYNTADDVKLDLEQRVASKHKEPPTPEKKEMATPVPEAPVPATSVPTPASPTESAPLDSSPTMDKDKK